MCRTRCILVTVRWRTAARQGTRIGVWLGTAAAGVTIRGLISVVSTPVETERYIRFQLGQLRFRNEHHQFEDICCRIAERRLSSNIVLATGPVGAGGDGGRDGWTFTTWLPKDGSPPGGFMALAADKPLVMACTLQQGGLKAKVLADLESICIRGERPDTVAYFTAQDIPAGIQQKLVHEALETHGVHLQIFGGEAISRMLAADDLVWVAQHFLSLPQHLVPSRSPSLPPAAEQRSFPVPLGHRLRRSRMTVLAAAIVVAVAAVGVGTRLAGGAGYLAPHAGGGSALAAHKDTALPLSVFVDIHPAETGTFYYVLATPVTSAADQVTLGSGTEPDSAVADLITRHGGAPVGGFNATIVLQGNRPSLQIVDIQPQILSSGPGPTAAFLAYPQEGALDSVPVSVDLDAAFPAFMSGPVPFFGPHQVELKLGERETFDVSFTAARRSYEFNLLVTYITGGRQYQQVIGGPGSEPFRIAAKAADYRTYKTVYQGLSSNQFVIADHAQVCVIFPDSRGC
jgi:hypothetical protein